MATLDSISTKVVAKPIPNPLIAEVVVANVGHIPNTNTKAGFSFKMPLLKVFQ
ncbi:hypothetical protein FACS189464_0630 [Bacteroidia bacterium]|nr:hypothetical protein FACS189464_0630 [Bacteroidia bacterium]